MDLVSSASPIANVCNCFHFNGSENTGGRSELEVSTKIACVSKFLHLWIVHITVCMVGGLELNSAVATLSSTPP